MTNFTLTRKGLFASVFLSLLTFIVSTGPLPAAITSTGNVEPSGTWTTSTDGYIGNSADGSLTVDESSLLYSNQAYIAYNSGVTGTATITGNGSKWTNSNSLYVGYSGNGVLTIDAGGEIRNSAGYLGCNSGSTGTATVTGAGSKWTNSSYLCVGYIGSGTLTIEAGGQVSNTTGFLSSTSKATVTGAGSKWTNSSDLYIGYSSFSNGALTIEAGGQVSNSTGYLGSYSGSTGTASVTGVGSIWTSNILIVGNSGSGMLTIAAGGQVSSAAGYLCYNSSSTSTATVTGAGSIWTNSSSLYVGNSGSGALSIDAGGQVSSSGGYLGYNSGSTGAVTVTGAGSMWTDSSDLYIGYYGSGVLTITAGGQVSNTYGYLGYAGFNSNCKGMVTVTGAGSKWTNSSDLYIGNNGSGKLTVTDGGEVSARTLYASLSDLAGNGIITANSAVLDADLVFDSTHGLHATVPFGSGGTINVTLDGTGVLGAGYKGTGSLQVADGITVASSAGYLGNNSGSMGTATVTGSGSTWNNSGEFYVGFRGGGELTIEAGGQVSDKDGYLGTSSSSKGMLTVTGAGSKWTNSSWLYVGYQGNGILHIRDGGVTTAHLVSIRSSSLLTMDAGYGSTLRVNNGTGTLINAGTIRFMTGPQPTAGSKYSPIAAGTWTGSGAYQALGGTWNATSHVFTVSQTLNGVSGTPVAVDLAQQQRVLVGDDSLNRTVGASFLAKKGTEKAFSLTASDLADVPGLAGLLRPEDVVLNAWDLSAEGAGYVATDPVYLSFSVPENFSRNDLKIWKLTGSTWSEFSADDLTVTGGYASFTSTGLSGYAVTVPEPAAMVLVLTAIMGGLFVWRRRR